MEMFNMSMPTFTPKLSILPEPQKKIWHYLAPTKKLGMTLYGGTAIALQLGHRVSIDFDFFTDKQLSNHLLVSHLPFLKDAIVTKEEEN